MFCAVTQSSNPSPTISASNANSTDQDAVFIQALQSNDREAMEFFVQQQQSFVYSFLRARMADATDVDDLCQEVFLRCINGKVKVPKDIPVRPWLLGVARNVLREHIRKCKRRKEVEWTELCLELDSMTDDDYSDYQAIQDWLSQCMQSLGQSAHEALKLHYYARLKMAQIADKMKRSEGAVKLLVFRARQALKQCMTQKSRTASHE